MTQLTPGAIRAAEIINREAIDHPYPTKLRTSYGMKTTRGEQVGVQVWRVPSRPNSWVARDAAEYTVRSPRRHCQRRKDWTMIQHTPEPWTIEHNHPDCAETAVIYGPDGQYVAHTSDQDAPLIAAAPRLLAACRWFCDHPGVLAEFAGPGLDLARSAVAADSSPVYDSEFGNSWVCDAPTPEGLVEIDQ